MPKSLEYAEAAIKPNQNFWLSHEIRTPLNGMIFTDLLMKTKLEIQEKHMITVNQSLIPYGNCK
jgi:hypothetical protein